MPYIRSLNNGSIFSSTQTSPYFIITINCSIRWYFNVLLLQLTRRERVGRVNLAPSSSIHSEVTRNIHFLLFQQRRWNPIMVIKLLVTTFNKDGKWLL
eukprot:Gb_37196 [translate_table: standard]